MYITNFNFLVQFGKELYEEQTREMIEMQKSDQPTKKITSLGLRGGEMGLKSRDLQKAHLGHLLNLHS